MNPLNVPFVWRWGNVDREKTGLSGLFLYEV